MLAALCGMLLCASGLFAASGDFCDSSLCLNGGTCLTGQDNDIYCLCPEGFTGLVCNETERGPCSPNPCYNDAKCLVTLDTQRGDIFTEYICQCPVGYSGIHCETGKHWGACCWAQALAGRLPLWRPRNGQSSESVSLSRTRLHT